MDWEHVYSAYPVNKDYIWLNNCGVTPAGTHIVDTVTAYLNDFSQKGYLTETASYPKLRARIKTILSDLLGCNPDELALIHHTAEGMNIISHGLALSSSEEVILLENEYPSNVYPWRHLEKKGVVLKSIPMAASPETLLEKLSQLITPKTKVVSVSAVHWCTGLPLPLERIGSLCLENGIDLVVDGAQGVGMQPINVNDFNISYMAFSAWKWLMGPLGMGVLYVSAQKLEEIDPVFIGTESVVNDEEYLPYKSELKPNADRFTYSSGNINDWVYFQAALEFLLQIGFEKVRERIFELSSYLAKGLKGIGYQTYLNQESCPPTGIVVCEKQGEEAAAIIEKLKTHHIVAAERLKRVRFSPHIYISPRQLDRVIEILAM